MAGALVLPAISGAAQQPPISAAFDKVWERADYPVAMGKAQRSWLWGPKALANVRESLVESPGGSREVQYYDKSRMEINDPKADPNSQWYVTNGLLVYEMISGRMQVGNDKFEARNPADVLVAGDSMSLGAGNFTPTYRSLGRVASLAGNQNKAQPAIGKEVNQMLAADGTVGVLPPRTGTVVLPKIQQYDQMLGHNIPDVFWAYMNQQGTVYENGQMRQGQVFNWLYAMGYPLTEPYWIQVTINNKQTMVMMQAFQRRLLTYNPDNAPEWRVEMGNVGAQYYQWRYGAQPSPGKNPPPPGNVTLNVRQIDMPEVFKSGQSSGIEETLYTTASTQAQWDALWGRHTAKLDAFIPAPRVDFKSEFVVGAFLGSTLQDCYTMKVGAVTVEQNQVRVTVLKGASPFGKPCGPGKAEPNDIVAVSRSGLAGAQYSVVFVDSNGNQLATAQMTLP